MNSQQPTLVQYYHPRKNRWHIGYLIQRGRKWTRVRRILAIGATEEHKRMTIRVLTSDTREVL